MVNLKFKIGDLVKTKCRPKSATGTILTTKTGWVNRLNQVILDDSIYIPYNSNYQVMKNYQGDPNFPIKEKNRTHLIKDNCHLVKFIKDRYGNLYRKPIYRVVHSRCLENVFLDSF